VLKKNNIIGILTFTTNPTPTWSQYFTTMAPKNFTMIFCLVLFVLSCGCEGRALRGLVETTDDDFHGSSGYVTDDTYDESYGLHGGYDGSDVYFGESDEPDDGSLDDESDDVETICDPRCHPVDESYEIDQGLFDSDSFDPVVPDIPDQSDEEYVEKDTSAVVIEGVLGTLGLVGVVGIIVAIRKKCKNKC